MIELMKELIDTWSQFWSGGWYQWLLAAALLYLFIFRRKAEHVRNVLVYVLGCLFVFWCPVTAWIVQKCIGEDVYWRVLWLLLTVPVCALAATEIVRTRKKIWCRSAVLVLVVVIAAVSGKSMTAAGVYEKTHNNQKIPYEAVVICDTVKAHAAGNPVQLATDDYLAAYIRVYDASITMPYGRMKRGALDKNSKKLYNEIMSPEAEYKKVAKLAAKTGCNYVACVVYDEHGIDVMEEHGFQVIGVVNHYTIFAAETAGKM